MASSYEYKESYSSKTTTSSTTTSSSEGKCCNSDVVFDKRYLKGIPGILKMVEAVSALIAYICVEVPVGDCGFSATIGYFKFVTLFCFFIAVVLWIFLLFKLEVRLLRCDCVNWVFIEMMIYLVVVILLFFGDLFLSIQATCQIGFKAGVFFGWVLFGAFCLDLIYMVYNFCRGRTTTLSTTTTTSSSTTAATTTNPEDGRY